MKNCIAMIQCPNPVAQDSIWCPSHANQISGNATDPQPTSDRITRAMAIKALSAMWDIAFPERSGERVQEWAETHKLCDEWDPDSLEDQQNAIPPGIWDLMLVLGVTPQELIQHCHANPKLFEGR